MRIAVFGAGGATGRHVVRIGLARGHEIVALVHEARQVAGLEPTTVVEGDARNDDTVKRVLEDTDAAISVLAIPATDEETTRLSDATRTIARRMAMTGPRRLVVTANTTIFHDREVHDPYRVVAAEHRRDAAMHRHPPPPTPPPRGSDLAWTVLAAPLLTDDPGVGAYEAVIGGPPPGKNISRSDFALAAIDALGFDDWARRAVGISAPV
jgi:nucleoside-diphosphate-sugar epimerase